MRNIRTRMKKQVWPRDEMISAPSEAFSLQGFSQGHVHESTQPATSSDFPKGRFRKDIKRFFGRSGRSASATALDQLGQDPTSDGGTVTVQKDRLSEPREQSAGGIVVHRAEDNSEHVIKESSTSDVYQTADHDFGVAIETSISAVRMNNWLEVSKAFKTAVDAVDVLNLKPIARVAVALLTKATQTILDQNTPDESVSTLLPKVQEIYEFLLENSSMHDIDQKGHVLVQIGQVVSSCSEFIASYSERKNLATRLGQRFSLDMQAEVDDLSRRLGALMQLYRNPAQRSVHINIPYRSDDFHINEMAYVVDAGLNSRQTCLNGTREEILADIIRWIYDPDPNVPRMFWLHGQAGRGKSAIAHTIALWCKNAGVLGSCFCFARDRQAQHMERRMFTTIARDLTMRDPLLRRAIIDVIASDDSLKTTPDVVMQWEKIIEPACVASSMMVGKVVIVIDALNESGPRHDILTVLATRILSLPPRFRIFITSRPLPDIQTALMKLPHVKDTSLDGVPMENDIRLYIATRLHNQHDIGDKEIEQLAQTSGGLFEWARLACEFIKSRAAGGMAKQRFNNIMRHRSDKGKLLDEMYHIILDSAIGEKPLTLRWFRSVMEQVLYTLEPLRIDTLDAMRTMFPDRDDCCYGVNVILEPMASLLSGVTDRSMPICPLHASFYDYLTDASRSGAYFVGGQPMHGNLAFASLSILHSELQFNICKLDTSYLCNSEVIDLQERKEANISSHLSYACRFWMKHLQRTDFTAELAMKVKGILAFERVLFWLEVLSLLNAWRSVYLDMQHTALWLEVNSSIYVSAD
ncbi:hypothetical protein ID866_5977 [Astraeus odoratus]|nr:hypothetical protein ID866_5977 [Astraeus odoratus]